MEQDTSQHPETAEQRDGQFAVVGWTSMKAFKLWSLGDLEGIPNPVAAKASRIISVTASSLDVHRGTAAEDPKEHLGTFSRSDVPTFHADRITLPDGQDVYLDGEDRQRLAEALGADPNAARNTALLRAAGCDREGEHFVDCAFVVRGEPKPPGRLKRWVNSATDGGASDAQEVMELAGALLGRKRKNGAVLLITNRQAYLLDGTAEKPGGLLQTHPIGPDAVQLDGTTLRFRDGLVVHVDLAQFGKEIVRAVTTASAPEPT